MIDRPERSNLPASAESLELVHAAAAAAADKLAHNVVAVDVSDRLALTDAFVVASAPNDRQVGAIVEAVEEALRARGVKPARREGSGKNRWVLLDFIDIVVHVLHNEERDFYGFERLWRDCPLIPLGNDVVSRIEASADGTTDDAHDEESDLESTARILGA
jgi:ribosome-associated protein